LERTDALQVHLPERVSLATIDCGWTRQSIILPAARRLLAPEGQIITLVKPHYEAQPGQLRNGVLPDDLSESVVSPIRSRLCGLGLVLLGQTESPLRGRGGNREYLWYLRVAESSVGCGDANRQQASGPE
jgi:23S rRNA (cytidine1920-2'-O)/16S rRNA (cytidine1409-2'-O)-methyltransferase